MTDMRANIEKVLAAFERGQAASGDSKRTCHTDGTTIYSYAMPIAWRTPDGRIVVVPLADSPSRTTSSQIRACMVRFGAAATQASPEVKRIIKTWK